MMTNKKKLKRKNKRLQYKVWFAKYQRKLADRDAKLWKEVVLDLEGDIEKLQAEVKKLKATQVQMYLGGEPMEVVIGDGDS